MASIDSLRTLLVEQLKLILFESQGGCRLPHKLAQHMLRMLSCDTSYERRNAARKAMQLITPV
jgi:hypothetical protein